MHACEIVKTVNLKTNTVTLKKEAGSQPLFVSFAPSTHCRVCRKFFKVHQNDLPVITV